MITSVHARCSQPLCDWFGGPAATISALSAAGVVTAEGKLSHAGLFAGRVPLEIDGYAILVRLERNGFIETRVNLGAADLLMREDAGRLTYSGQVSETLKLAIPGRKLPEIFSHPLLEGINETITQVTEKPRLWHCHFPVATLTLSSALRLPAS